MGGLHDISVSPRPFGTNWGFEVGWTGLELGPGIDNIFVYASYTSYKQSIYGDLFSELSRALLSAQLMVV